MYIDPLLTEPARLKVLAVLASCDWAEFSFVCETTGLSKSALSKQITKLEASDYVQVHKGYMGKFPHTTVRLTGNGRAAIEQHLTTLQDIVNQRNHDKTSREQGDPS